FFNAVTTCPPQLERTHRKPTVPLPGAADTVALFKLQRATPLNQQMLSDNCPWYRQWTMNSDENAYWGQLGLNHAAFFDQLPPIPMAFLGGWYDQFLGGTVIDYQGAPPNQPVSLTLGPWVHDQMDKQLAGAGYFGPTAPVDRRNAALQWFSRYLKGVPADAPQPDTVRYFLMGGGTGD